MSQSEVTVNHLEPSIHWDSGVLVAIDQRVLPHEYRNLRMETVDELIVAIQELAIRGAPLIGLAGGFGVALSAFRHRLQDGGVDEAAVRAEAARLATARPTAANLAWGVQRALARLAEGPEAVLAESRAMLEEDTEVNLAAARRAADLLDELLPDRPLRVLTHCNTGRLATATTGTALGTILELAARGRVTEVLVDETRPLLQGARLTAWELAQAGIPHRVCVDSAAAFAISQGLIDCVFVGADRIAANGDTANKIGTYSVALAAARTGIPFVVVAPESTWDARLPDGSGIEIEERAAAEVTSIGGVQVAPAGARAYNPAFDVTPADLITAVVSERRVFRPGASAEALGTAIAGFCRTFYDRGWMPGTAGNLSVRSPAVADTMLITQSGLDKGELTWRDMVALNVRTSRPLDPDAPKPSSEAAIHAVVYRRTNAGAVIHVHAPYSTAAAGQAMRNGGTLRVRDLELLKGLGLDDPAAAEIPVVRNHARVSHIADEIDVHLGAYPMAPPAVLIADHGITVWGRDLAEARNRLECLEAICQLLLLDAGSRPADLTSLPEGTLT
jgi:methylthioribose-1-phosphate isomerase